MDCTSRITIKSNYTGVINAVPCNQCLACRINNRDFWVARALLESQTAIGAQFWTLTFNDNALLTRGHGDARKFYSNFLKSLRMSEKRKGNTMPIRSFGCLEFGGTSGRPHLHLIIWNQLYTRLPEEPYLEGLPRPQHHIKHWRHGHVDCCPVNTKSLRYVAKYVSKLDQFYSTTHSSDPVTTKTQGENMYFHPKRPALGSLGLEWHMDKISRSPTRGWVQEPSIELDGKKWGLPPIMYRQWRRLCLKYGLKHQYDVQGQINRKIERWENEPPLSLQEYKIRKQATQERLWEHTHKQAELREFALLQRAVMASSPAN